MKKFDAFALFGKIHPAWLRYRFADFLFSLGIPFGARLRTRILLISPEKVVIESPHRRVRNNHLGGAHACALALLGEYPAGLVVAQNFPFDKYRIILTTLRADYHKQGRGTLVSESSAPAQWPSLIDGAMTVPMKTRILNQAGELVAETETVWQIKEWARVRSAGARSQIT